MTPTWSPGISDVGTDAEALNLLAFVHGPIEDAKRIALIDNLVEAVLAFRVHESEGCEVNSADLCPVNAQLWQIADQLAAIAAPAPADLCGDCGHAFAEHEPAGCAFYACVDFEKEEA